MKREVPQTNLRLLHEIKKQLEDLQKEIQVLKTDLKDIKYYHSKKKIEDEKLKRAEQTESGWFVWG